MRRESDGVLIQRNQHLVTVGGEGVVEEGQGHFTILHLSRSERFQFVMAGLVPAIHVFLAELVEDVECRA
jgi:hypothetical protein